MEDLYIIYNGQLSLDFNIVFDKLPHRSSPQRDIESIKVLGRNGNLTVDNECYENKVITLEAIVYADSEEEKLEKIESIKGWLQSDYTYKQLIFSDDLEHEYQACCINKIDFNEGASLFDTFPIIFECKPLKKCNTGLNKIGIVLNNTKIYNNGSEYSEPYLKIYGTGDVTIYLSNNKLNQNLIIKDIIDFIEVDSEMMNCYRTDNTGALIPMNNKMYTDFPVMYTGETIISWIGNITKIELIPRWVNK